MFSCKKDSYIANFDELPQERIGKQIDSVRNILTTADNGWIATLPTGLGGGYGFYMTFDNEGFVNMYADMTDETSATAYKSQYRVRQDMGANLVFDTYTYISWLNNPEEGAFGGVRREGFRSDIDFIYDHSTPDSIIFIGKRYRQTFSLVKATAAQKAKYTNGDYKTSINEMKNFFQNTPNAYFEINGLKVSVEPNISNNLNAGKRITFTSIYDNDSIGSNVAKYAFTMDQMPILDSGLLFNGINFNTIGWKDPQTFAVYDDAGKEYIIKNNPTPLLPLYKLWGTKYTGMFSDFKKIYPGTSQKGADIINFFHLNMENGYNGFPFNYSRLTFEWNIINKRLTLKGFSSQNGGNSGWTTNAVYNYTVNERGEYTFTLRSDLTGGYVSKSMAKIHEFILNNKIKFDYHVDGSNVYAKMMGVDAPDIVMTFELLK